MKRLLITLAATGLLWACGGGAELDAPREAAQVASASTAPAMPQPINDAPLDVTLLLDWAEREYPTYFPGRQQNMESAPYIYRYYPKTRNYVGVAGEDVYILGPLSNNVPTRVGSREDFRCSVTPDDCPKPGYARAGWVASLSQLQHGVSGTVTIVDERTLRLSDFNYDGGGPQVYAYLGGDDTSAAFRAGKLVGPRLNRASPAYVNATLDLQLPEGQTMDGFTAVSIWCSDFHVNFGSGAFRPLPKPTAS